MWLVSVCGGRPDYSVAAVWPSRGFGYCHWCRARHPRAGGSSGEGRLHIGCIAYTGGSLRDALFFKVGSPWHEVIASDPSSGLAEICSKRRLWAVPHAGRRGHVWSRLALQTCSRCSEHTQRGSGRVINRSPQSTECETPPSYLAMWGPSGGLNHSERNLRRTYFA